MKVFGVLCFITFVKSDPQLDLPRSQSSERSKDNTREGPEVLVLPNSYTNDKQDVQAKSDSSYRFDSDRSQRFGLSSFFYSIIVKANEKFSGPPYDDENEEFRGNQRQNEQPRYNNNNNNNRNPVDTNRDNFRFPQNNDDFNTRSPPVRNFLITIKYHKMTYRIVTECSTIPSTISSKHR